MDIRSKIFGYVLGDGWIDIKGNGGISGEQKSLETIMADIDFIYGENSTGKIVTKQTSSPYYGINGTTSSFTIKTRVVKDLRNLGMPQGKRVNVIYHLPFWVVNGSKDIKASFLSGYYSADGAIPDVQSNHETPRPFSFCFYKSKELESNADFLAEQYCKIVEDLGFNPKAKKTYKVTESDRVVYTITIDNQRNDFLRALKMLDLSYCRYREKRRQQLVVYLTMKENALKELLKLRDAVRRFRAEGKSYKEITAITGLSSTKIDGMISGKNKCRRVVGFPKFDQDFISRMYSPIKTPLNDENLKV